MPSIQRLRVSDSEGKSKQLLEGVQRGLGMVPNLLKTLAQSSSALAGYLSFSQALSGALTPALREQIALTVAGVNHCNYCASAHTALGAKAGIHAGELAANVRGKSGDQNVEAALRFASAIVEKRGWVSDDDLKDVRAAAYSEAQIVEIVAVVALNLFTNYFNHVAATDIDFPVVDTHAMAGSGHSPSP